MKKLINILKNDDSIKVFSIAGGVIYVLSKNTGKIFFSYPIKSKKHLLNLSKTLQAFNVCYLGSQENFEKLLCTF